MEDSLKIIKTSVISKGVFLIRKFIKLRNRFALAIRLQKIKLRTRFMTVS